MNRRGFFALLGIATVAPKALKLAPVPVALPTVDSFFGIDRTPTITGLQGWLPADGATLIADFNAAVARVAAESERALYE